MAGHHKVVPGVIFTGADGADYSQVRIAGRAGHLFRLLDQLRAQSNMLGFSVAAFTNGHSRAVYMDFSNHGMAFKFRYWVGCSRPGQRKA